MLNSSQRAIVLFFASFRSEVDTGSMIRRALTFGKRVVLPKVKGTELELYEIANWDKRRFSRSVGDSRTP